MKRALACLLLTSCLYQTEPQTPSDKAKLAQCRSEAIAAYQAAQPDDGSGVAQVAYEACKRRLGVSL